VVSSTLEDPEWTNSTVIGTDLQAEVPKLKDQHERDIVVHGSGQVARGLLDLGLLDELRLMVFPVVLGKGKRPFEGAEMSRLKLTESKTVGSDGVIVLVYEKA
jgi:dihydrofolate reductase